MKILVVSLLRIGDALMITPVLNGLKNTRPDAQIDLLTFRPVAMLKPMLPIVSKWWTLDRDELQAGLGQAEVPLLTSYSVLQEQLDTINAEEYDLIINLSQTNFSAWISGYLKANDRLGFTFDVKGQPHFYSPWFRYLNDQPEDSDDIFHHTDIFAHACGLGSQPRRFDLTRTEKGREEVEALKLGQERVVTLQLFTSDVKKNWGLERWLDLVAQLQREEPPVRLVALGAPNEEARVDEFIREASERGVLVQKAILSMEGALSLLDRSALLISGDTSIKHLANATGARVLELSTGWGDWRRMGVYKPNSLILRARQGSIDADTAARAARALLNDDWSALTQQARGDREVIYRRTRELEAGFWFAEDLAPTAERDVLRGLIERAACKVAFNRVRNHEVLTFGSEGMSLKRDLKSLFGGTDLILTELDFLERQESEEARKGGVHLLELRRQGLATRDLPQIAQLRRRQMGLERAVEHAEFKTKLIRVLKSNWTETI